jgi:hypothetical protein
MEEHSRVSGGVEIVEWFLAKEICIAATGAIEEVSLCRATAPLKPPHDA